MATYITVTAENCFHILDIIGTSSDGSVSAYSWTIASGVSQDGPWTPSWNSPTNINQKTKTFGFTTTGWYKVEGVVYGDGDPTNAVEVMNITEVCSGTAVAVCTPDIGTLSMGDKAMTTNAAIDKVNMKVITSSQTPIIN